MIDTDWVTVLGHDVHIRVRPGSDPTRPPLVMCNGIGAGLEVLQPFVDAVDPRIEVVSFDVPGVGLSPDPKLPYRFPPLAAFVTKMLCDLGYDRFDVLGISWGGGLAQQLAFQNPGRCRRVVLVATGTGSIMVPAHPRVLRHMVTPRRYRDPAYAREIAGEVYGGLLRERPELVAGLLQGQPKGGSRLGYLAQLFAGAGWTSLPFLPLVRQPVLILAGRADPLIPLVNARIMHRLLPNASVHVYDDGHLGLVTQADTLGPLVSQFLDAGSSPG